MTCGAFLKWLQHRGCIVEPPQSDLSDTAVVCRSFRESIIPKVPPDAQAAPDVVQKVIINLRLPLADLPDLSRSA